jgi:hypothetical protein
MAPKAILAIEPSNKVLASAGSGCKQGECVE